MKRLRVLVLVHPDLIPPESTKGFSEQEINVWKTEYDVVTTLRTAGHEVRPLGVHDELKPIRDDIEAWKPDVVFTTTGYQREWASGLSKEFPVYAIELPVSLPGIIDMAMKVGLVTGLVHEGSKLSRQLLETLSLCKPIKDRLRIYLEIDFSGPVSFGAYSYITDAMRYLGVESIFGAKPCEWLTPDLDFVKASEPNAIVYEAKMFSRFDEDDLKRVIGKRGWENLTAVKSNRVFLAPGPLDFFAHHGPSFILEAVPWLRTKLDEG